MKMLRVHCQQTNFGDNWAHGNSEVVAGLYKTREEMFKKEFKKAVRKTGRMPRYSMRKAKRSRSAFTTDQVNYLEQEFKKCPYIESEHRREVANALNLSDKSVKIWFQNRRMKEKKDYYIYGYEFDDDDDNFDQFSNELAQQSYNESTPRTIIVPREQTSQLPNDRNEPVVTNDAIVTSRSFPEDLAKIEIKSPLKRGNQSVSQPDISSKFSEIFKRGSDNSPKSVKDAYLILRQGMDSREVGRATTSKVNYGSLPSCLSLSTVHRDSRLSRSFVDVSQATPSYASFYMNPSYPPQPFVAENNLTWTPINLLPVMSGGASAATISSNMENVHVEPGAAPKKCSCDCHTIPPVPNVQLRPNHYAQYVITSMPKDNSKQKN